MKTEETELENEKETIRAEEDLVRRGYRCVEGKCLMMIKGDSFYHFAGEQDGKRMYRPPYPPRT